jgi:uncharacterized protein YbjQ (UPF0145 family)
MNTKPAAPVIFTVSLVVLIGGGAGTAAWGGPVSDDRAATQVVSIVRGHVVVRDDLSPIRGLVDPNAGTLERVVPQAREFSAEAIRELKGGAPQSVPQAREFSADAIRELKGSAPQSAREVSAEARRELHPQSAGTTAADAQGQRLAAYAEAVAGTDRLSASEMQGKRLSAYADAVDGAPQTDTVAEVQPHGLTR